MVSQLPTRLTPLLAAFLWLAFSSATPVSAQAPAGPADSGVRPEWAASLQKAEAALLAGRYRRAERQVDDLLPQLVERLQSGEGASELLARVLLVRAGAEAGRGDQAAAVWSWHEAQSLDSALRREALPAFGADVVSLLEEYRLRQAQEVPAGLPALPEDGDLARYRPSVPVRAPEPETWGWRGQVHIDVLVGADGRVSAPVLEDAGEATPGQILRQLEALRDWRFQPATYGGEPVAVTVSLRDLQAGGSRISKTSSWRCVFWSVRTAGWRRRGCWPALEPAWRPRFWPQCGGGASSRRGGPVKRWRRSTTAPYLWPPRRSAWRRRRTGSRAGGSPWGPWKTRWRPATRRRPGTPPRPREEKVEGVVIVQSIIGENGRLRRIRVLKGLSHGLDESALATLCSWRFKPARLDGEPIEVYYNLTVNFTLH